MSHIKKMQTLMTHEQSCKMCGSIYISWVHPKALNYSYFRCLTCRHEWLNIPTDSEGENHFESIQKVYYEDDLHYLFSPFSHYISANLARKRIGIVKKWLKSGRLLEIGPGTGEMIIAAKKEGFDIQAVEYSNVFVKHLQSVTDTTIYHGLLESVDFGESTFDGILSFHVLEHVPDPVNHLQHAFKLTKPGGYLILATPNASSWDRHIFKNRWIGYSPGHLNLFLKDSIKLCMERAGWSILRIDTFESSLDFLWSIKAAIRPKKFEEMSVSQAGSNLRRIPLQLGRIILLFFGALTLPLRFIQQQSGGGNELFIIAQKVEQ